jgi:putative tryptophan/tyrosine transport system substrate-binding protein
MIVKTVARLTVAFGLVALSLAASAQQAPNKIPRIGYLGISASSPVMDAFRERLHALGWIEGQNIVVEYRFSQNQKELAERQAKELVALGVSLIATTPPMNAVVRKETSSIPIIFCWHSNPVGAGDVASLARPGGNMTGVSMSPTETSAAKRLQLLKQMVPSARKIAVLVDPMTMTATESFVLISEPTKAAARQLGVDLHVVSASTADDLDSAFAEIKVARLDALLGSTAPVLYTERARVAAFALEHRLPSVWATHAVVEAGGLLSLGADLNEGWRSCAGYVDKILKGANPAELPVEQSTKYLVTINSRTADALGLTIPPELLASADEIIE